MATKIDLEQLDEFVGVLDVIQDGQSVRWDDVTQKFVPYDSSSFGTEFFEYFELGDVSTSSILPQSYLSVTTDVLEGGDYKIDVFLVWRTGSGNTRIAVTLEVDTVQVIPDEFENSSHKNDSNIRDYAYGTSVITLTPGTHDIEVLYRRSGSNGTVYLYEARVQLTRVA